MKHLKNKRGHTIKDAFQEFAICFSIVVMSGSSIYLVAALTTDPEPVTVSPTMPPIVHIITQEPEETPEPADKPVETPIPTWDVVPSLGDDPQARQSAISAYTLTSEEKECIHDMALTMWKEAENVQSMMEQAGVGWCVLNRVDSDRFPDTIHEVVSQPGQFHGYQIAVACGDCPDYFTDLATDVYLRWKREKAGEADVGRVLPAEYLYFEGDFISHNYFRTEWMGGLRWWWTAKNPYED